MVMLFAGLFLACAFAPYAIAKSLPAGAAYAITSLVAGYIAALSGAVLMFYLAAVSDYGTRFTEDALAFAALSALLLPPIAVWRGRRAIISQQKPA